MRRQGPKGGLWTWMAVAACLAAGCGKPSPDQEYQAGLEALRVGQLGVGMAKMESALALAPAAPFAVEAHTWLGLANRELKKGAEALAHFEQAAALAPASFEATYNLGCAVLESGDAKRGLPLLRKAADMDPSDVKALLYIGDWTARNGRWDLAKRMYGEAQKRDSRSAAAVAGLGRVAFLEGDAGKAEGFFLQALGIRKDYAPALYNLGVLHSQAEGGGERAKGYFRQYLDMAPKGERAVSAAQRLQGLAAPAGAAAVAPPPAVEPSASEPAKSAAHYLKVGRTWLEQGRPADAREALMKAQAQEPENPRVLFELARASVLLEQYDAGVVSLRALLKIEPGNADALWMLAEIFGDKLEMMSRGVALYREFERRFPADPRALEVAGRVKALQEASVALPTP